MALNPPLNSLGDPLRVQGENYLLERKGIEFEIKILNLGKFRGKGKLILTSNRIILINKV